MKRLMKLLFIIILIGFVAAGCEMMETPIEGPDYSAQEKSPAFLEIAGGEGNLLPSRKAPASSLTSAEITLSGFQVHYDGRTFDGSSTTFSYTVSGPAVDMHFRLELPGCAPRVSSFFPSNGVTNNNDAFINPGVEWHPSVGSGTSNSFNFSVTYPGRVPEGMVLVSVKNTSTTEVGEIAGACAGVFDISGTVFTDANNNGLLDGNELGIPNSTVHLFGPSNTIVGTESTDDDGYYLFEDFPSGNYTVAVNTNTIVLTSTTYLDPSTPTAVAVSVGPDSDGNDFGFEPKTEELINDLKFRDLETTGRPANYWKNQLKVALTGNGSADFDVQTMESFAAEIRNLLLPDPFVLPGGNGLQAAFDILDRPVKTDREKLERELLAAEFNHVAGFGINATDSKLQLVLIGWGESLLSSSGPGLQVFNGSTQATTDSLIGDAVGVFAEFNGSGGGGGGSGN
jgi:hypothetical protein